MKILTDFVLIPWGDWELELVTFQWFTDYGILYNPITGDRCSAKQSISYTENRMDIDSSTIVVQFKPCHFTGYYIVYPAMTKDSKIIKLEPYNNSIELPLNKWIDHLKSKSRNSFPHFIIHDVLVEYTPSTRNGVNSKLKVKLDFHLGDQYTCPYCQGDGIIVGKRLDVDDYEENDCPICEGKRLLSVEDYHDDQLRMLELKCTQL